MVTENITTSINAMAVLPNNTGETIYIIFTFILLTAILISLFPKCHKYIYKFLDWITDIFIYFKYGFIKLPDSGKMFISMKTIDSRVADVLRVKFKLGLFDHPYVSNPAAADTIVGTEKNEAFVLDIQRQSLVLLKNANNTLPLDKNKLKN